MDTRDIPVTPEGIPYPAWAIDAVRRGVRTALELLRSPLQPVQVVLSSDLIDPADAQAAGLVTLDDEEGVLGDDLDDAGTGARRHPTVNAHTGTEITISYPAVTSPAYLGPLPHDHELIARSLAFCAGYGAARFAMDAYAAAGQQAPWLAESQFADDDTIEAAVHAAASHTATVASGFTTVATLSAGDAQSDAVRFFLERLDEIRSAEGPAAIWRGMLAQAIRALSREVRFSAIPGKVGALGYPLPAPSEVHALLRFVRGDATWPFPFPPVHAAPSAGR